MAGGLYSIGDYELIVQTALLVHSDDSISEATNLGAISTTPQTVGSSITPDVDVDMYRFTVNAGQVVDFDIDTPLNGPPGLNPISGCSMHKGSSFPPTTMRLRRVRIRRLSPAHL